MTNNKIRIIGNYENKYQSKNPISRYLVNNFLKNFKVLIAKVNSPNSIIEIGAGEGYLSKILCQKFIKSKILITDISPKILQVSKKHLINYSNVNYKVENIEKLNFKNDHFDLVVCCEVFEHVNYPEKAIREIYRILKRNQYAIVSVPQEPIWRILNILRLKYITNFGNTPGHINHWSKSQFSKFIIENNFKIIKDLNPFPWAMLLIIKK